MEHTEKKQINFYLIFGFAVFLVSLAVLSRIGYSDGDDAFFLEYTGKMNYLEYLSWRYEHWSSRFVSESLFYFFFRNSIWVWRLANAALLTALIYLMIALAKKCGSVELHHQGQREKLLLFVLAAVFFLVMRVRVFAYACIWISGSIVYLPGTLFGLAALYYTAGCVFDTDASRKHILWALPCSLAAVFSAEQMGAVVIAFELIACGYLAFFSITAKSGSENKSGNERRFRWDLLFTGLFSAAAFVWVMKAPGNAERIAVSVEQYFPVMETATIPQRLFLTLHWLISSFANENALLIAVLLLGVFLAKEKKSVLDFFALLFAASAVFSAFGVKLFCDLGLQLSELSGRVDFLITWQDLNESRRFAMLWWGGVLGYTLFYLCSAKKSGLLALCYLAGIAAEAVMFFSPTIYASGERVFFTTNVLLWLSILNNAFRLHGKKRGGYILAVSALGVLHFAYQIPVLLASFSM